MANIFNQSESMKEDVEVDYNGEVEVVLHMDINTPQSVEDLAGANMYIALLPTQWVNICLASGGCQGKALVFWNSRSNVTLECKNMVEDAGWIGFPVANNLVTTGDKTQKQEALGY